jgi:hypothetical protein
MHTVRFRVGAALSALALTALVLTGLAWPASASTGSIASRAAASGAEVGRGIAGPSGCHEVFQPPSTWVVVCSSPGGPGGSSGGGGGGGGGLTCSLQPLSPAQEHFLGLPKPPAGEEWAAVTCPGKQPFGGVTLVSKTTGVPKITPRQLAQYARSQLRFPPLRLATAPPRGHDGLVGLAEWFWVPGRDWGTVRTGVARAGPVWAQVTATPVSLTYQPGGGLAPASCAGPGTPYRPGARTGCSFTYQQSSATQPGGRYAVTVTSTWQVTWRGGTGPAATQGGPLPTWHGTMTFELKVAEGQALVTKTGVGR